MISIRRSVFETNSSSTHSICVANESSITDLINLPNRVVFRVGNFGWEFDEIDTTEEKASYLYTAILLCFEDDVVQDLLDSIRTTLAAYDITCVFINPGDTDSFGYFYDIDHPKDLRNNGFFEIINDDNLLMSYLFDWSSFILTGNDNSRFSVNVDVPYPHKMFFKGN